MRGLYDPTGFFCDDNNAELCKRLTIMYLLIAPWIFLLFIYLFIYLLMHLFVVVVVVRYVLDMVLIRDQSRGCYC